jgi:colanic acid biosynthesis protein WcaH
MGHPLLDKDTFQLIIQSTPLVSIDLIVRNERGQYLLGRRKNRPAQGYWFVPGGRIFKNEKVSCAFERIVKDELNLAVSFEAAQFLGLYDHFYQDCVFSDDESTHYVVNAFILSIDSEWLDLPSNQHEHYQWATPETIIEDATVHIHTQWYFQKESGYFRNEGVDV